MGHPPQRLTIDEVRDDMGCAWRSQDGKLYLATFGEFLTPGSGGRTIKLTVAVPDGIDVERNDHYEMSRTGRVMRSQLERHSDEGGVWYSFKDSSEKWTPIRDEPNPKLGGQQ